MATETNILNPGQNVFVVVEYEPRVSKRNFKGIFPHKKVVSAVVESIKEIKTISKDGSSITKISYLIRPIISIKFLNENYIKNDRDYQENSKNIFTKRVDALSHKKTWYKNNFFEHAIGTINNCLKYRFSHGMDDKLRQIDKLPIGWRNSHISFYIRP